MQKSIIKIKLIKKAHFCFRTSVLCYHLQNVYDLIYYHNLEVKLSSLFVLFMLTDNIVKVWITY